MDFEIYFLIVVTVCAFIPLLIYPLIRKRDE